MKFPDAYDKLRNWSTKLAHMGSAMALLHWDQSTQIPKNGMRGRADVIASLAGIRHGMATDPEIGNLLDIVTASPLTDDNLTPEAINIREWRRGYDRMCKIPQALAHELAHVSAEGQFVWQNARPDNDWGRFKPYLQRLLSLKQQEAECIGYVGEAYDALLDIYELDLTTARIEPIFRKLAPALADLTQRISSSMPRRNTEVEYGKYPIPDQRAFALMVAKEIGYDLDSGRLDASAHPFTTGIGPGDVRITTRYSEDYFNEGFFAVIHEAGHAIYHQGLPLEYWGTPFCSPASLGVNESQSRMWENFVARSAGFWKFFYPFAQEKFSALKDIGESRFLFSINKVNPSLIRVEADEVTYNLHVLFRFELELALMRGNLMIDDLPEAWNSKMDDYLGLRPRTYAEGVLQDVHWSGGAFGYFPTYTLGNIYAAQLIFKAEKDLGSLEERFAAGDYKSLLAWLRTHIHQQGRRYAPSDLILKITGEKLNADYLIRYLTSKYKALYEL